MSGVSVVTRVEVEAALQRIGRGESVPEDANLLRSVIQRLEGELRMMEEEDPFQGKGVDWGAVVLEDGAMEARLRAVMREMEL